MAKPTLYGRGMVKPTLYDRGADIYTRTADNDDDVLIA